ncbi:MAG: hypothetical protein ACOCY1_00400 [Halovenus sp.]
MEILGKRIEHGVSKDVSEGRLRQIAQAAEGDARRAIAYLREAVRNAEADRRSRITDDDVRAGIPDADQDLRRRAYADLTPHQQAVYQVIDDHGPLSPGEIEDRYQERMGEDARTGRMVREYRKKLQQYRLIEEAENDPSQYVAAVSGLGRES